MSGSMNKAILVGNLGRDPEVRFTQTGEKVAQLNVATSERWKDQDGNVQNRTDWHRVVLIGKLAEVAEAFLKKGAKVLIEGKFRTRKWTDRDGQDRYTTEIVVAGRGGVLTMLDRKSTEGDDTGPDSDSYDGDGQPADGRDIPF